MSRALVILAGGAGRRLGAPKATARLFGTSFAQIQIQTGHRAGCAPVVLALGCEAEPILAKDPSLKQSARVVVCLDWQLGQFASLRAGLASLLEERPGAIPDAFVLPVDALPIKTRTFEALAQALHEDLDATVPIHGDRRGHPVLLSSRFWPRLLEEDPARARLDHILARARVGEAFVDDPGVLTNVNTPKDLEHLKGLFGALQEADPY